jgi:hypothetical protein
MMNGFYVRESLVSVVALCMFAGAVLFLVEKCK